VQLDKPRAVCIGEDITLGANVCKLIFLVLYSCIVSVRPPTNRV
jgi:hypothetical protein